MQHFACGEAFGCPASTCGFTRAQRASIIPVTKRWTPKQFIQVSTAKFQRARIWFPVIGWSGFAAASISDIPESDHSSALCNPGSLLYWRFPGKSLAVSAHAHLLPFRTSKGVRHSRRRIGVLFRCYLLPSRVPSLFSSEFHEITAETFTK